MVLIDAADDPLNSRQHLAACRRVLLTVGR